MRLQRIGHRISQITGCLCGCAKGPRPAPATPVCVLLSASIGSLDWILDSADHTRDTDRKNQKQSKNGPSLNAKTVKINYPPPSRQPTPWPPCGCPLFAALPHCTSSFRRHGRNTRRYPSPCHFIQIPQKRHGIPSVRECMPGRRKSSTRSAAACGRALRCARRRRARRCPASRCRRFWCRAPRASSRDPRTGCKRPGRWGWSARA